MDKKYGTITIPLWFLGLERKYLLYSARVGFSILFLMVGFIGLVLPLGDKGTSISSMLINDIIILYYVIFYSIFFGVIYTYWWFLLKPYKSKDIDVLSYYFYKVGIYLEEINRDFTLDNKLKRNIRFLSMALKKFKKYYRKSPDIKYIEAIKSVIKNISKLNNYKTEKIKKLLSDDILQDRFFEIGKILHFDRNYTLIEKHITELSEKLGDIQKIKSKDKYPIDIFSILILIGIITLSILAIFIMPEHQTFFTGIITVLIPILIINEFGRGRIQLF